MGGKAMDGGSSAPVLPKKISDGGLIGGDSVLHGSFAVAEQSVRNTKTSGRAAPQQHDLMKIQ